MANGASFIADLQRIVGGNKTKLNALARQSIQELAIRVQTNTGPPIGPNIITGFLISSWQPGINAPPPKPSNGGMPEPGQTFVRDGDAELTVAIATMDVGDVFYYYNNAKYAMAQNYGFVGVDSLGRHRHLQGKHFLEKTLAQWPQIVAETAVDLGFTR